MEDNDTEGDHDHDRALDSYGTVRKPTSVDVARAAGVSQATVSRALNNGTVSEATRSRIQEVSRALGYTPNGVARSLVTSQTHVVGVVVSDITNPFYPEFLEEIALQLSARGYQMALQNAGAGGSESRAIEILIEQRVDGIIFTTATTDSPGVLSLLDRRFPVVLANRIIEPPCDKVSGDNYGGAVAAGRHLIELGHRRIATIEGPGSAMTSVDRSAGFATALNEDGIAVPEELRVSTDFSYVQAYAGAHALLSLAEPPTAIFCHNDLSAFAAMDAALSLDISIPEQVSIVGFDNTRLATWRSLNLTTISQPLVSMAAHSVQMVTERIVDPRRSFRSEILPCELMVRGTTGPARSDNS